MDTSIDEDALITRAKQGDPTAWETLVKQHEPAIRKKCEDLLHLAGPTASNDLEDCCQNTFVNALRAIGKFRGNSKLVTWLCRIAENVVRLQGRRCQREKELRKPFPFEPLDVEENTEAQQASESTENNTQCGEAEQPVSDALAQQASESYEDYTMLLGSLQAHRPSVAAKLEQQRRSLTDRPNDTRSGKRAHKFRRTCQRRNDQIKKVVYGEGNVLDRRGFATVAASLAASPILSGFIGGSITADELDDLVQCVQERRVETGDVPTCRSLLDRAWVRLPERLAKATRVTPSEAATLLKAIDLQIALSLDAFDMQTCSVVLLPLMERLLRSVHGYSGLHWQHRFFQNQARFHFHQEDFPTAFQFAKRMTDYPSPAHSRQLITDNRFGTEAIMTGFEVGSFLGKLDFDLGMQWWRDARKRLVAAGDGVDAARVEARIIQATVENAPKDAKLAAEGAARVAEMGILHPPLVKAPLFRVQQGVCRITCLIVAGLEDMAISLARELATVSKKAGYVQGAVRVRRAFVRVGSPELLSQLDDLLGKKRRRRLEGRD